jgi:hypothetical protein
LQPRDQNAGDYELRQVTNGASDFTLRASLSLRTATAAQTDCSLRSE